MNIVDLYRRKFSDGHNILIYKCEHLWIQHTFNMPIKTVLKYPQAEKNIPKHF